MNTTKRPESLEEALAYKDETMEQFNARTVHDDDNEKAYKELKVVSFALNGGKVRDYKDTEIPGYVPVFTAVGSRSGFSFAGYDYVYSDSFVGARLRVNDPETARYFGTQFISIWDRYING